MYGLLLENLAMFIKLQWGEVSWESVRRHAGIDASSFSIHHVYAETLIPRLARSAVQVLGVEEKEFFDAMGVYFVEFVGQFGYDQTMSVLGRHMRDFLNGLDNLHEYLKFSFPKMRAPSFFCENETVDGLMLHYRSKRRGFVYYTMGQIKQVAKHFYNTDCMIELKSEEQDGDMMHVIFQLYFDNRAYIKTESLMHLFRDDQLLPFRTSLLFELFPFCIIFNEDMVIQQIGQSLTLILKDLVGQCITETFDLVRPLVSMTFHNILERRNNTFEIVTVAPINDDEVLMDSSLDEEEGGTNLRLKGQMLYMDEWNSIMFLATPIMPDLDSLLAAGLYINDLSLHDCSRDLILAGTQQSLELKLALEQEQQKSRKLEDSMRKLDDEMRRTDELLYQMIPKQVADRIRLGENPVDTCQVYDVVSILFSDVVTFTEICSRINPMQVVSMLNHMYSLFDQLTERNGVYKVETIGDSYMVVSGAPNQELNHAERICDMAMDMIDASMGIFDPSRDGEHLKLRVGVHSGNVVAGVVGLKMPRWCLFGDAVNTSSRMESSSEAGRIQISEKTVELLPGPFQHEFRGEVPVKGKGNMKTYWLLGREGRVSLSQLQCNTFSWAAPQMNIYSGSNQTGAPNTTPSFGKEKSLSISESEPPLSRAKSWASQSQDSIASKHDGHLPLTHQHTHDKMNLDAAKQAVNKTLMKKKAKEIDVEAAKTVETQPDNKAPPTAAKAPESMPAGNIPATKPNEAAVKAPVTLEPVQTPAKPEPVQIPAVVKEPEVIKSAVDPKPVAKLEKQENTIAKSAEPVKVVLIEPPTLKKIVKIEPPSNPAQPNVSVTASSDKGAGDKKAVEKDPPEKSQSGTKVESSAGSKSEGGRPSTGASLIQSSKPVRVEPVSYSIPLSDPAQNQKQDANYLIAKATLRRNSTANRKSEVLNDVGKVGSKLESDENLKEKDDKKGPSKDRLLKRIRGNKNKVALLTSEAMAQLGCSGFAAKQKEVINSSLAPPQPNKLMFDQSPALSDEQVVEIQEEEDVPPGPTSLSSEDGQDMTFSFTSRLHTSPSFFASIDDLQTFLRL